MAANTRFPPWTDDETEALITRYQAGDLWRDIVPAVCAASGNHRSKDGCRKKAFHLNLTVNRPRDYNRADIDTDLEDMIMLGYSKARMARELGVCPRTVYKHAQALRPSMRYAWKCHARNRQLQGLASRHQKENV